MDQSPYSNREIDFHFSEIKETLFRIENQTIKTNGRVSALEKWRWLITGGLIILGATNVTIFKAFSLIQ